MPNNGKFGLDQFPVIRPDLSDPLLAPHWAGLRKSHLSVQQCTACLQLRWPPAVICPTCLGVSANWIDVKPRGELWSYAVYHRAYHPAFADYLPYYVGLIELDAGIKMISQVLQSGPRAIRVGARVHGEFITIDEELTVLKFATEDET
jgi:uncharacterized protein